jgi:hypothetical protein
VERLQALQAARPASAYARGGLTGRMFRHPATGLILELPDGWKYVSTDPSSDNGQMVTMSSSNPKASISLWLIPEQNDWTSLNARLDGSPDMKVENRISMGMSDYRIRAGSRQRVTIAGNPAMVAIGDYTGSSGPMEEYLVWIYTENTHTFFFSMVPAGQLAQLKPQFDALVNSTIIP